MPLEAGFGIELKALTCPSSVWIPLYTYYNHGLEPPHGGVKSCETTIDHEMSVDWFDRITEWTEYWVGIIAYATGNHTYHDPDLPLEYKLSIDGNGAGDVVLDIVMETLDAQIVWTKATGLIIFKSREAFDLSWGGFLFYLKALEDFSTKVKEQ